MRWQASDEQDDGSDQSNREQRAHKQPEEPGEILSAGLVGNHRGDQQGHESTGQQPPWPDNEVNMESEVKTDYRKHGDERRPSRFRISGLARPSRIVVH
jgi:hypothetical protein